MTKFQYIALQSQQPSEQNIDIQEQKQIVSDTKCEIECQSEESQNENLQNEKVKRSITEITAFPTQEELQYPQEIEGIPLNYKFNDFDEYVQKMSILEREKSLIPIREALNKYLFRQNNIEDECPMNAKGIEIIRNFELISTYFNQYDGLIMQVIAERFVPQNEDNEIKENQLIIVLNKENKQMHLGKSVYQDQDDNSSLDDDSEFQQNNQESTLVKERLFIQICIDNTIPDLLANIKDIATLLYFLKLKIQANKYWLIHPDEYWHSTELSLNCIRSFSECKEMTFPNETLQAKFEQKFPNYSFLNSDDKINQYKESIQNAINNKSNSLDYTQLKAFEYALSNQNAIIQGPPGTGKTFLMCEIIKQLLNTYSSLSNKPILVLSKKNKSLDVLLLKISQFTNSIVRMGSGITIEEMEQYSGKARQAPLKKHVTSKLLWSDIQSLLKKLINKNPQNKTQDQQSQIPGPLKKYLSKKLVSCLCSSLKIEINQEQLEKFQQNLFDLWISENKLTSKGIKELLEDCSIQIDLDKEDLLKELIQQQKLCNLNSAKLNYEELVNHIRNMKCFSQFNSELRQMIAQSQNMDTIQQIYQRLQAYKIDFDHRKEVSNSLYQKYMSKFMDQYRIIGMTFSGFHKNYDVFSKLNPEIVLVEEASEVLETEFFPILSPWLKHLIQIGDHQQLRPIVKAYNLKKDYNLEKSYFERLISINKANHITLLTQRRMRPEFANITRLFYGYKYTDYENVKQYIPIDHINQLTSMYMMQHTFPESDSGDQSIFNEFEALFATEIAYNLVRFQKFPANKITIICMYSAQSQLVQDLLNLHFNYNEIQVNVSTVDKYQGQENDIIILSCVRSNKNNDIGFLSINNRINVAFSRAKIGFICLGNFLMYEKKSEMWQKINWVAKQQKSFCEGYLPLFYLKILTRIFNTYRDFNYNKCEQCQKRCHTGYCGWRQQ